MIYGNLDKALDLSNHALEIAQETKDKINEGRWTGFIGEILIHSNQIELGITEVKQALMIAREIGDRKNEGIHLQNLGIAYQNLGQVEKACEYSRMAYKIFKEIKSPKADKARKWLDDHCPDSPVLRTRNHPSA